VNKWLRELFDAGTIGLKQIQICKGTTSFDFHVKAFSGFVCSIKRMSRPKDNSISHSTQYTYTNMIQHEA
jgi:hypothetical protein